MYNYTLISPESIINNPKYRKMLLSTTHKTKLVAVVVDEAHCVKMWGNQFRMAFAQIGCVRSLVPKDVKIMALTATATQETLQVVTERLAMHRQPCSYHSPSNRANILYKVQPVIKLDELSFTIAGELADKRTAFPKTVLFCRQYQDLYAAIHHKMGTSFAEPLGYPDLSQFRMVELYTRVSTPEKREQIITSFTVANSRLYWF